MREMMLDVYAVAAGVYMLLAAAVQNKCTARMAAAAHRPLRTSTFCQTDGDENLISVLPKSAA